MWGNGADYAQRLTAVQSIVDDATRNARFADMQRDLYTAGGDLVWGFQEALDASTRDLGGVRLRQSLPWFAGVTRA